MGNLRMKVLLWLLFPISMACLVSGAALASSGESSPVHVAEVRGYIGPPVADYVERVVRAAEKDGAQCVVLLLDTPGGLDSSMRKIVEALLGAEIPTVVYVSPKGARAASAGVFIAASANVLAMAPGTNIGAAHPVGLGGELPETIAAKATNDAAAYIKSIAEERGRNADWLQKAVRESVSVSASEAVELGVADLMVGDLPSLMAELNGRTFTIDSATVTLQTSSAHLKRIDMNFLERFLYILANPDLAQVLLSIGMLGIIIELLHFGLIVPGFVGVVSLVLAYFSLGSLPLNWAGLILIALAFLLFVVAAIMPGHAVPEVGGIISFVLGSLFLFTSSGPSLPEVQVSRWLIGLIGGVMAALAGYVFFAIAGARRAISGSAMVTPVGQVGVTTSQLTPAGTVQVASELWSAIAEEEVIGAGEQVEILAVEGLRLRVRKSAHERK